MTHNKFDSEYYVMNVDGAGNRPILAWGATDFSAFLEAEPIDEKTLDLPLKIIFGEPYPQQYEMADLLMLDADFAGSEKLKNFFEKKNVRGIQFIPVEITSNKGEIIGGNYAIHFWNRLSAIDKNNYEGEEPNMFGNIMDLKKFSLDAKVLEELPLEKRLIFQMAENAAMLVVHDSVREAMLAARLTGMRFWKVAEWDEDAMFR